jgi:hypothetical protein
MNQTFKIDCQSLYISYNNIHLEKEIVDLKTGFFILFSEHF